MRMSKFKRVVGLAAATVIAGALPVLAAGPAQAAVQDCADAVHSQGYVVGPKVRAACGHAQINLGEGWL